MSEIRDFLLHLRLKYNFLILSAPFILGAIYAHAIQNLWLFAYAFLLIYVLLFGGANSYNSYIDDDKGPIGGLEHPPKMTRWMYWASWIVQVIGLALSIRISLLFSVLFAFSIILFWIYSGTFFRFKSKPLLSFVTIGVGTVVNIVFMGYVAAGGRGFPLELGIGAIGAMCVVLSMYPFSQAYQIQEDKQRGDMTFAARYGLKGIRNNYIFLFYPGIILLAYSFHSNISLSGAMLAIGIIAGFVIWQVIKRISGKPNEYGKVMKTKYYAGLAFTSLMVLILIAIQKRGL